jgi:hypothetical protein
MSAAHFALDDLKQKLQEVEDENEWYDDIFDKITDELHCPTPEQALQRIQALKVICLAFATAQIFSILLYIVW